MAWVLKGVKSGRLRTEGIPQRQDDTAYILTTFNTRNTPVQLDIALWNMLSTIYIKPSIIRSYGDTVTRKNQSYKKVKLKQLKINVKHSDLS